MLNLDGTDDGFFSQEDEARADEEGAAFGDARRCPIHPHVKTSSDDGMFDTAGCHECEAASDDAYHAWQRDTTNMRREVCGYDDGSPELPCPRWSYVKCLDSVDLSEIPF